MQRGYSCHWGRDDAGPCRRPTRHTFGSIVVDISNLVQALRTSGLEDKLLEFHSFDTTEVGFEPYGIQLAKSEQRSPGDFLIQQ